VSSNDVEIISNTVEIDAIPVELASHSVGSANLPDSVAAIGTESSPWQGPVPDDNPGGRVAG
jgi:hypothetical protein